MGSGRCARLQSCTRAISVTIVSVAAALTLGGAAPLPTNPLFRDQFVADPAARVFNGRVYIYATNDSGNDGKYWISRDWRAFSSADLTHWTDHGSVASVALFNWASGPAWAPDAIAHNGQFYLILPVDRTKIGVARGPTPTGPFVDNIGGPLIEKGRDANAGAEPIDPAVFIDRDNRIYMAFGTRVPKLVKLSSDLKHIEGGITNSRIEGAPSGAPYGEAPWLYRRGSLYYFVYSTGWPGQVAYATARKVAGPYRFRGIVLDRMNSMTNHESIVDFKGHSYLFYHNMGLPGASDFKRSINLDRLFYRSDGSIRQVIPTGAGAMPGLPAVLNPAK